MWKVLQREYRRFGATPRLWMLTVIAPVVLSGLLLTIFIERVPARLPIAVLDYDNSHLSRLFVRTLDAAPGIRISRMPANLLLAGSAVRRCEVYGVVAIPPDFYRQVLRNEIPQVQFYYNRQMMTAGNIVARDVRTVVATFGAGLAFGQGIFPPVRPQNHPLFNPGLDYARFLALPLVAAMLHILIVLIVIDVTGRELREGTAGEWMAIAGQNFGTALLAKLLPYALWFAVTGPLILAAGARLLDLEVRGSLALWMLGWLGLEAACFGLGLFLIGLSGNLRIATSVASVILSPAFAYSGMTFPSLAMSGFASAWSQLLPLGNFLNLQAGQLAMGAPAMSGMEDLLRLLPFAVLPLLVLRRLQRLMTTPSLWGAR